MRLTRPFLEGFVVPSASQTEELSRRMTARRITHAPRTHLDRFRSQKYCQTNEESVLLNLLDKLPPIPRYVVDIGAGDGVHLSNTQIFVESGWSACRIDRDCEDAGTLHRAFVDRDNVTSLLRKFGVPHHFGILSLDIDGNDLYVLNALLHEYRPAIVVFEFNGCRPPRSHDVICYDPEFVIDGDYYGAAWSAFEHVFRIFEYTLVHHSHSLNGYAVDSSYGLPPTTSLPAQVQYHPHRRGPAWHDARVVFPAPSLP